MKTTLPPSIWKGVIVGRMRTLSKMLLSPEMETTLDLKRELLPVKIEDATVVDGDAAGDGLRSRLIRDQLVVADLLDNLDCPNAMSPVVVLAGNQLETTAHCLDGEDAVDVVGVRRI
ncbi:hypothetical protein ACLOJK_029729 [Asimina triloba]